MPEYPPILLVAFGTTLDDGREAYCHTHGRVQERFPHHEIHWAYSSSIVRRRLEERGVAIPAPREAFAQLAAAGHDRILVQSLHIVPGEQHSLVESLSDADVPAAFGRPLMTTEADIQAVATILASQCRDDAANVVVVHGNTTNPAYNVENHRLAEILGSLRDDVVVASIEGTPGDTRLATATALAAERGTVHFMPMLIAPGRHVTDDVMGTTPESWASRVAARQTLCGPTVAMNDPLLDLLLDHLAELI